MKNSLASKLPQSKLCWRAFIMLMVASILIAVIVPTWKVYTMEGRDSTLIRYSAANTHGESLHISSTVLDVDFAEKKFRMHCIVQPNGTLANQYGQLNQPIRVSFSSMISYNIEAGESDNPLDVSLSYNDGDEIDYPFDKYTGSFEVAATYTNDTSHAIPITFQLIASLTSYAFEPTLIPSEPNQDRVGLHIVTGRSTTTIGFSLFVCVLMWAMSLVMLLFGYQVVRCRRHINAHASMIGLTMLFALPALRSAQPGAPAIGCTSDILSFYWNMAIIACVSIAILSCWVIRWSKEDDVEHRFHSQQRFGSADIEKPCVEHFERLPSHSNPMNNSEITVA